MNYLNVPGRMPMWQRFSSKSCKRAFVMIASLFISVIGFAQITVHNETIPNQYNTGFAASVNSSFTGSTGTWAANSNAQATIVCVTPYYNPSTSYAIKIVNWNTQNKSSGNCKATSPVVNLSANSCSPNVNMVFTLWTYACTSGDNNAWINVDFSSDGGTSWTNVWTRTSAQLFSTYGANGKTNITVPIASGYRTSNFKYRFTGNMNSNDPNNFYLFIDDIKITATACTPTCTGRVTSLYFNKLDGGADLPISNGATFSTAQLGSLYNLEASATGTVGSVKYTISGPTASSNIENVVPYNSPGTGSGAWTGAPGAYSVNLKTYSGSDATGTLCHDTTITFNLANDCNCPSTLLTNGSFESGQTGWTVTGGTFSYGPEYTMCGAKNGYLNHSSGTAKIYQDVTGIPVGATVNFKGYAGTHAPGLACSPKLSLIFLNASNVVISQANVNVTKDVGSGNQLELYMISAVVPAGATKVRVQGSITCNTLKVDGFCISYVVPNGSIGDFVWKDLNSNGLQDPGEPGIPGVNVTLTRPDATTITVVTDANGAYVFSNLPAGTYSVSFETPVGYVPTVANEVTGDDSNDSDPVAGIVTPIVLAAGQNNTTVDAGFIQLVSLSGNVWHDVNAMGDNLVNNTGAAQTPPASAIPVGLRMYLVNTNTGLVEKITLVSSGTGTFSFSDVMPNTNYRLYLSMAIYPVGTPEGSILTNINSSWEHTGQKNANPPNSPTGSDGINDGRLTVPVGNTNVINANFGIRVKGGTVVIG